MERWAESGGHGLFNGVRVINLHLLDLPSKVLLYLLQHVHGPTPIHKVDGQSVAAKPARATDAVEVGLKIWPGGAREMWGRGKPCVQQSTESSTHELHVVQSMACTLSTTVTLTACGRPLAGRS